ncbi:MAG TPA: CHAT domain-containing protein, partial [Labilithrix sp.]|nr:CHAT domain-containing protein [Labilithrix sp.]
IKAKVGALDGPARERWEEKVGEYRDARALVDADAEGDWKRSRAALDAAILARASKLQALRRHLDEAMALDGIPRPAANDLPTLPASEVTMAFVRLGRNRRDGDIFGFVVAGGETRAYRVRGSVTRETPPDSLGDALLGPARKQIDHASMATRFRVMTDDALGWIDVHALPLDGSPLVARAPVVYSLDLGPNEPIARRGSEASPLVVADPTGDLPSARDEGEAAARALADPRTRTLVGREATATRVRAELATTSLFHYAGHGVFRGRDGAESALPLSQGGSLTLGDVLTLDHVPQRIVLSGCETGRQLFTSDDGSDEGAASMAQAFLVAGAETVVAPVRVVDDRAAGVLATGLHHRDDAGSSSDFAASLRRVQLEARRKGDPGWEAFRAFVR